MTRRWHYHAHNIETKIKNNYRELRDELEAFKKDIYIEKFKSPLENITSVTEQSILEITEILNDYYILVDDFVINNGITSQSKFRSTILEEFIGHLLDKIDLISDLDCNFYNSKIFAGLKIDENGKMEIQTKNVDFCIGKQFTVNIEQSNTSLIIPLVAIECKTYLDNTMFSEAQFTATKLKNGTPNVSVYIISERNEVGLDKIPSSSPVDEVFIIRKDKNSPIESNVLYDFYKEVNKDLKKINSEKRLELPGRLLNF